MSDKIIKNVPRNIFIMILLIFITFKYLIRGFSKEGVIRAIETADIKLIAFAIILSIVYILCEAFNTKIMLNFYGYKTSLLKTASYAFSGYFFSGLTPSATGGQPMQVLIMKNENIKIAHSSLILMVELCIYQFVSVIIAIIGFYYNYKYITSQKGMDVGIIYIGIFINLLVFLFIFFAIFSKRFINFIRRIAFFVINTLPIKNKDKKKVLINKGLQDYRDSSIFIKNNKRLMLKILAVTTIQILLLYSISYLVYVALGYNKVSYHKIVFLQALAYVSVSSLPLPGAIGISEKLFQFLFRPIYDKNMITEALVLTRGANFYILFIISAIIFFITFGEYIFKQREVNNAKN